MKTPNNRDKIAIIGIGCRFPGGANSPAAFWSLLCDGVDAISEIPRDRWNIDKYYHPVPGMPGKTYARWGGFLDSIDQFDPTCFGIAPREAAYMDPQQRLLLEVAWEALEDGGQVVEQLAGSPTGVFVGVSTSDYAQIQFNHFEAEQVDAHAATGGALSIAAGRISYCFNLQGPCLSVDTACSSSLVATHLACQSIWSGESDLALACGVNVIITPGTFVSFSAATMLSPDGRCKAFDASANGFVRSEGAGAVVLKPLSKAIADGDPIYAVIANTGVNQDGRTSGISAPSQGSQEALMREVYRQAGVDPHELQYVEAHGTGTAIGDPIETNSIGNVLSHGRTADQPCVIGSVKTNIGHLEAASGVAGLIKATLMLKHGLIPPNLHFKTPNPDIAFDALQLRVPTTLEPWPTTPGVPMAGVNSFGFGGTNAHVLLTHYSPVPETSGHYGSSAANNGTSDTEDMPQNGQSSPASDLDHHELPQNGYCLTDNGSSEDTPPWLLPLSALSPEAVRDLALAYRDLASSADFDLDFSDLCYTASLRRTHFDHRASVVFHSRDELIEQLNTVIAGERRPGISQGRRVQGRSTAIVGVFSGQGPQWWAMGRELLQTEPVFRQTIDACDAIIARLADWSLMSELTATEAASRLHETAIAQPAIFALQTALARLWQSWGVDFKAVVGHSVGEIAAAHIAGALSLDEAVRVIFHRGRTMDLASSQGRMLAVGLSTSEAQAATLGYEDRVALAAINGPTSATLSGDPSALEAIAERLEAQDVFNQFLRVNYAFHSMQMDPVEGELLEVLADLESTAPTRPIVSTVTGEFVDAPIFNADYWWQNVRQSVRFAPAIDRLIESGYHTFVEVSAHPVLSGSVSQCLAHREQPGTVLPSLRRHEPERAMMLASLGGLYTIGYPVDWQRWWPQGGQCAPVPTYPWQHQAYWHESAQLRDLRLENEMHPFVSNTKVSADPTWEGVLDTRLLSYLQDHRIQGQVVFPGSGYVEMGLAAARAHLETDTAIIEDLQFQKALFLPESDAGPTVQTICYSDASFAIYSRTTQSDQSWMLNAMGSIRQYQDPLPTDTVDIDAIWQARLKKDSVEDLYNDFNTVGLPYGPAFRPVTKIWRIDGEALGQVQLHESLDSESSAYSFHPSLLDGCFQMLAAALPHDRDGRLSRLYLPTHIERVRFYRPPTSQVWSHVILTQESTKVATCDYYIYDDRGALVMDITGFRCQALDRSSGDSADDISQWFYDVNWHYAPLPEAGIAPRSAAPLPTPKELAQLVAPVINELNSGLGWSASHEKTSQPFDDLATAYILQALAKLGWGPSEDDSVTVAGLIAQLGIIPQYERFTHRFLHILTAAGYLAPVDSETWAVRQVPPPQAPQTLWHQGFWQYPDYLAELQLIERCGSQLAEVLSGTSDPLDCLFPDGSTATLEHLFQDAPTNVPYNLIMQQTIRHAVGQLPSDQTLRVLEIGAGTGGMTTYLLPELPSERTEYVFTDISQLFLTKAEQQFRAYDFIQYGVLDIEQNPADQGYAPQSFDLVLALNVVHATCDVRDTLKHAQQLVSPNGLFIMVEIERTSVWPDLVFGMTDGWWRFADTDLRPSHPLMSHQTWRSLLEEGGWSEVAHLTLPLPDDVQSQVVMLAQAPPHPAVDRPAEPTSHAPEAPAETGSWLIFADQSGVGRELAKTLGAQGDTCVLVTSGETFDRLDTRQWQVDPDQSAHMAQLFQEAGFAIQTTWRGVIHLWSLDTPPAEATTPQTLHQSEVQNCHSVMHIVQVLDKLDGIAGNPQLVLVTRGAQPLGQETPAIGQTPLIGLGRTIVNEYPNLRCKFIDLSPQPTAHDLPALLVELRTKEPDEEVALRRQARFVPRLERARPDTIRASYTPAYPDRTTPYRLALDASGVLDNLSLNRITRVPPGPGQVEIAVAAAALNFRDVMKALGLIMVDTEAQAQLGDECAGTVVAVGEGVETLQVGDEVVAIAPGSFGSYVLTKAELVAKKPAHLSFAEVVTMPIVFLTCYYALHELARIRPGERVLVHAGAGGVGLAAIQIAQHAGAEVFATAGNPEKRALLKRLGVDHVMDSRSLTFADRVLELTDGQGVDIVVNSLAGQALTKGLACLTTHGRFLELGKRDIYENSKIGLWPFRNNISFFAIDLSHTISEKPALIQQWFNEVLTYVNKHTMHPLPFRVFPISRLAEAVRYMAQARHIGKVVISMQETGTPVAIEYNEPLRFHADATYAITGGFGGFGLTLARWIVERGGRHLVLMGRSGAASDEAQQAVAELEHLGAQVTAAAVDVSQAEQVADLMSTIRQTLPPLRGVFHTATVVDDGLLLQMDGEQFRRAMDPKVVGTWNLHAQTCDLNLDYFVLFSSVSSLMGNPGQANYVAANTFVDTFATYRRSLGLAATAINWGQLEEVGFVARHADVAEHLNRAGILGFSPQQAMEALEHVLQQNPAQVGVMRADWHQFALAMPSGKTAQRLVNLLSSSSTDAQSGEEGGRFRDRLVEVPAEEREPMLEQYMLEQVARVLGTSAASLDSERALNELGLDSLMAIELKNRVESDLSFSLPTRELMQMPTIKGLTAVVLELSLGQTSDSATSGTPEVADYATTQTTGVAPPQLLMPLRAEGTRPPLFVFHPVGGQVTIYTHLVDLLPKDQPVIGLQSRLVSGAAEEYDSIEAMAHDYLNAIRQHQPEGPYYFLGFSFGGYVATAITHLLEQEGEGVAFVGLIDCDVRLTDPEYASMNALEGMIAGIYDVVQREGSSFLPAVSEEALDELSKAVLSAEAAERPAVTINWLQNQGGVSEEIPIEALQDFTADLLNRFESHLPLIPQFQPPVVQSPLHIWWAQSTLANGTEHDRHWGQYTQATAEEVTIAASHYVMMQPPYVATLATQLNQLLQSSREREVTL